MRILPTLFCLGAILSASVASPPNLEANDYVLVVGRAYLGAGPIPEVGPVAIVVREGIITAVETDFARLPSDLPRVEHADGYLTPGLVAAATDTPGPHRGSESVAAGYRAIDGFDRYGDYRPWLAQGVTTAHLSPGEHRLLSGEGAIVKFAGAPGDRVVRELADLCLQLGDAADAPPPLIEFPFPPSSDVAIEPAELQRPRSRLGRLMGLEEELARALADESSGSVHRRALANAWNAARPLRISADRATDLLAAIAFVEGKDRVGVLVGGQEALRVAEAVGRSGLPLVYRPRFSPRSAVADLGLDLDAIDADLPDFAGLRRAGIDLVLGPPRGGPITDLRFSAVLAHRAGLDRASALRAITDGAADALGLGERLGRIAPGRDADFVLWNSDPLSIGARPLEVIVDGKRAFRAGVETGAPKAATVVRAGTIWISPERQIQSGELLIEDGQIVAVGSSVPRPPHARIIEAGPGSYVTPGFIDARSHLGLGGDRGRANLDVRFGGLVGAPDVPEARVARAGITTVLLSPYTLTSGGSPFAAVKTSGSSRSARLVREVAAVAFTVSGDALDITDPIVRQLGRGKKYIEKWKKYEKALAEWEKKKAQGEKIKPVEKVEEVVERSDDPITGIWEGTASGGPLPEPQTGKISLRLSGNSIEGRVVDPPVPVEHRIIATLEGTTITGTIEADMDLPASPEIRAELTGEDTLEGTLSVMGFSISLTGKRISKEAAETRVTRRRTTREDGKPTAPTVDPSLEPLRDLLEKKIPAVVQVNGRDQIRALLDLFVDQEKLPLILLDGAGSIVHAKRLAEKKVGVIVPVDVLARQGDEIVNTSDRLTRGGVSIAFQSRAEDGARTLPTRALYAVDQGLSADAAIAALTTDVARMFQLADRIGSLEPGCDGDLLIFRGHPFRDGGRLERVLIDGEEVSP